MPCVIRRDDGGRYSDHVTLVPGEWRLREQVEAIQSWLQLNRHELDSQKKWIADISFYTPTDFTCGEQPSSPSWCFRRWPARQIGRELKELCLETNLEIYISEYKSGSIVEITDSTYEDEYRLSREAIRDFLFMYFDIANDSLSTGFDYAELGGVDPFRYLDIEYGGDNEFLSNDSVIFLHRGAAVNLLCRIVREYSEDDTLAREVSRASSGSEKEELLSRYLPELLKIYKPFTAGRITREPSIRNAFDAAFNDYDSFHKLLGFVVTGVINRPFELFSVHE